MSAKFRARSAAGEREVVTGQGAAQRPFECPEVERLEQVLLAAGFERRLAYAVGVVGGDGDDGDGIQLAVRAYLFRRREPVEARQVQVQQDKVGVRDERRLDRLAAVRGGDDAATPLL